MCTFIDGHTNAIMGAHFLGTGGWRFYVVLGTVHCSLAGHHNTAEAPSLAFYARVVGDGPRCQTPSLPLHP